MITLFLRSAFLYLFVFLILRLTGKRQVSDLQPFDLLITLLIADLAGCSIVDADTPLLYSIVPILAMYLVQQGVTFLCLKSAKARRVVCGSPVILVRDGAVMEAAMRDANYTLIDLLDQLRSKDVFDLRQVAYAILETNGSMSVLQKGAFQTPTLSDLGLSAEQAALCYMLILDGALCHRSMETLGLTQGDVLAMVGRFGPFPLRDVFYLHRSPDGGLAMQLKARAGGACFSAPGEPEGGREAARGA